MKEEKSEINTKLKALEGSQAKVLPVAEGTKWTCVGD